jgi:PhoPQ-activated pathogenicity-related protein
MNHLLKRYKIWGKIFIFSIFVFLTILPACKQEPLTPENALSRYIQKRDSAFSWTLEDKTNVNGLTYYSLKLTSQKWRDIIWKHQLVILVPEDLEYQSALLYISGGSNESGEPIQHGPNDDFLQMISALAVKNSAIVAALFQVPNQPLFGDRYEDEIISYTFHQMRSDDDYTWPLLLPMAKSAVRAIDAVQNFGRKELNREITDFVITGESKRGWTTWLTGASDERVMAIAPMVIDVVNMGVQMDYQIDAWGAYSPEISDYVNLGLPQDVETADGIKLRTIVDPYSYREKLLMPKLILLGTNDPYWPVDAVKHYFDDLPGEKFIHYAPNAEHSITEFPGTMEALSAFFGTTIRREHHPALSWTVERKDGKVLVTAKGEKSVIRANLWQAVSEDRDFRDEQWIAALYEGDGGTDFQIPVEIPRNGYKAFYVDLVYPDPNVGEYSKSTRMFVADQGGLLAE